VGLRPLPPIPVVGPHAGDSPPGCHLPGNAHAVWSSCPGPPAPLSDVPHPLRASDGVYPVCIRCVYGVYPMGTAPHGIHTVYTPYTHRDNRGDQGGGDWGGRDPRKLHFGFARPAKAPHCLKNGHNAPCRLGGTRLMQPRDAALTGDVAPGEAGADGAFLYGRKAAACGVTHGAGRRGRFRIQFHPRDVEPRSSVRLLSMTFSG